MTAARTLNICKTEIRNLDPKVATIPLKDIEIFTKQGLAFASVDPKHGVAAASHATKSDTSAEERRALDLLAGSANGCTTSLLRAHSFSSSVVAELITAGLATATSGRMRAGQQR
jgi:hypothetical protein